MSNPADDEAKAAWRTERPDMYYDDIDHDPGFDEAFEEWLRSQEDRARDEYRISSDPATPEWPHDTPPF